MCIHGAIKGLTQVRKWSLRSGVLRLRCPWHWQVSCVGRFGRHERPERLSYQVKTHLLVMAFLQRITNGQGRIEREYAAGRGRVDLAIEWSDHAGKGVWIVIEIKVVHPADGRQATVEEGLKQTARYRDTVGAEEAYLIVFDRREKTRQQPWENRLTWEEMPCPDNTKSIAVIGACNFKQLFELHYR